MTSPQDAPSEVVAVIATTESDDHLPTSEQHTAVVEALAATNISIEPDGPKETILQDVREEQLSTGENAVDQSGMETFGEAEKLSDVGVGGTEQNSNEPSRSEAQNDTKEQTEQQRMEDALKTLASMGVPMDINSFNVAPVDMGMYYQNLGNMGFPQGSMDGLPSLPMALDGTFAQPFLDPSPYIDDEPPSTPPETRISAFAKLIFQDGEFYMNTHSVILGRDLAAARAAMRRDKELEKMRTLEEAGMLTGPMTPDQAKKSSRYSKSIVSESGGILREGNDKTPEERERRRRLRASKASRHSKKSKSTNSSSEHQSRRNSLVQRGGFQYQPQVQTRRGAPETVGAIPVDPASLRPSPNECPTIGIHPPAHAPSSVYTNISRQHARIAFNTRKSVWEVYVMGRNGIFVDGEFHACQSRIPLASGAKLQIGGVEVTFLLPDIPIGETGGEENIDYDNTLGDRYSVGGKEMSFDFEDDARAGAVEETSEEGSENESARGEENEEDTDRESQEADMEGGDEDDEGEDDEDDAAENTPSPPSKNDEETNSTQMSPKSEKKRGPGRPPKNGIMSKREQKLAKKQALAQAEQKAAKKTESQPSVPGKNKVGRPRKYPRPETPPIPREKRKYTKRKPKEPKDGDIKQEGSGGEAKEKKEKKPPKPPRSPSPTFNEADLTPEQLAKPQANYVTLIHEALSNSPTGQMSLPQIYRAIQRKYPFFVLKCPTNGWQSSVRHNLSQHNAFRKVERDGKGWMWAIVEGASIEKEKKKRNTPPPQGPPGQMHHHQPIYQAGHPPHMILAHPYGPPPPGMMGPPPGYSMNHQTPPNMQPGHPPSYIGPPMHMSGHPPPPSAHMPVNGHLPPGLIPPIPPQLAAHNVPGSYSSPYAPKPGPASGAPSSERRPSPDEKPLVQAQSPPTVASLPTESSQAAEAPVVNQDQQPQQVSSQNHPTPPIQAPLVQPQAQQVSNQPQQPKSSPSSPPPLNDAATRAIEAFKETLTKSMKEKIKNAELAEAIVESAVNRVLGKTNQDSGDPHEDAIVKTLRGMLSQIPGANFLIQPSGPATPSGQQNGSRSPPPTSQTHHPATQANQSSSKVSGADKPAPTYTRPSFSGQGQSRTTGPSISRPPMKTPGMMRTNSGSSTNASTRPSGPSASPAPGQGSANGASTPNLSPHDNAQLAGQKRPLDDADDMREYKKLSTSGPPQLKT